MSLLHKFAAAVTATLAFASAPALADVHVSFGIVAPEPQIVIRPAPPPRPVVVRSAAPCEHAYWIDGDWHWDGYRWVWTDGYWSVPTGHYHAAPRVVVQRRPVVVHHRPVVVQRPVVVHRNGPPARPHNQNHRHVRPAGHRR